MMWDFQRSAICPITFTCLLSFIAGPLELVPTHITTLSFPDSILNSYIFYPSTFATLFLKLKFTYNHGKNLRLESNASRYRVFIINTFIYSNIRIQGRNDKIKLAAPAKSVNNRYTMVIFMIPAERIFGAGKSPFGLICVAGIYQLLYITG